MEKPHKYKHDCESIIEKVDLALDGELSLQEEKEFLAEIEKCSCCLEKYSIEKNFKKFLLSKIEKKKVSSDLIKSIKQKIKQPTYKSW